MDSTIKKAQLFSQITELEVLLDNTKKQIILLKSDIQDKNITIENLNSRINEYEDNIMEYCLEKINYMRIIESNKKEIDNLKNIINTQQKKYEELAYLKKEYKKHKCLII